MTITPTTENDHLIASLSPRRKEALRRLLAARAASGPGIGATPRPDGPLPCSYEQAQMWLGSRLGRGAPAPNATIGLRLTGPLDVPALTAALDALVARHEVLRTVYEGDGPEPRQVVLPPGPAPFDIEDLRALPGDEREECAREITLAAAVERFDLTTGPLLRTTLVRLADEDHVLLFVCHHIACDGWSVGIVVDELTTAYAAAHEGRPVDVTRPAVQYADYALWSRRELTPEQRAARVAYWRDRLDGASAVELPTAKEKDPERAPGTGTGTGVAAGKRSGSHLFTLPAETLDALRAAGGPGTTPFVALLTVFSMLLSRYTGGSDLTIASVNGGRRRMELEPVVGCFVNPLPLRADLSGNPTFPEVAARVRRGLGEAVANHLPFAELAESLSDRDARRFSLSTVGFSLRAFRDQRGRWPGLTASVWEHEVDDFTYDLALLVHLGEADDPKLYLTYQRDRFDEASVTRLAGHFRALAERIAAAPGTPQAELELLTGEERELALGGWNDTARPYPEAALPELLERHAGSDAVAVAFEGRTLTHAELHRRADQVARLLRGRGIGPEDTVGVLLDRGPELIACLLGVWKAGAAYLPMDPKFPAQRIADMLDTARTPLVLTSAAYAGLFAGVPGDPEVIDVDGGAVDAQPAEPVGVPYDLDRLAYVIFTSGSTGRPKGVQVTHRGLVNHVWWAVEELAGDGDGGAPLFGSVAFDLVVPNLWAPLAVGRRVTVLPQDFDMGELGALLVAGGPYDFIKCTPGHLEVLGHQIDAAQADALAGKIVVAGEALPGSMANRWLEMLGPGRLINEYGPTEASVGTCVFPVRDRQLVEVVPIGRPLPNMRMYVLDAARRLCPVGVPGELYVGGVGVTRGYLNRPDLTDERFLPDPFAAGGRMYRTGDRVSWLPDGNVAFLGRFDDQVKIRGYRIELDEVRASVLDHPGVRDAVVTVHAFTPEDKRLVAYYVPAGGEVGDLAEHCAGRLPDYMVPSVFVPLEIIPLNQNGKVDRRALPDPVVTVAGDLAEPTTPTEVVVAGVWREVLGIDAISVDADFNALGGHSLLLIRMVAKLRQVLPSDGYQVTVLDAIANRTVRELAALADRANGGPDEAGSDGPRGLLVELTRPVPSPVLSLVCIPYGGASAMVYQPLADALPSGHALFAVALPGHELGVEEDVLPFHEAAQRIADEVIARVRGPVALYGHCVGSALTAEIARRLEAAGRRIEAVYMGGSFPFATPTKGINGLLGRIFRSKRLDNANAHANWLRAMGADLQDLEPDQVDHIIRTMRVDARAGEDYFTELVERQSPQLRAPVISVIGDRDALTDFYQERYRDWHAVSETTGLVVLAEAGHYFLRYRTEELARIVTTAHTAVDDPGAWRPRHDDAETWWAEALSSDARARTAGAQPSLGRFFTVATGQIVSMIGAVMTEFAIPIWAYLKTGSLVQFGLFAIIALVPGLILAPLIGALVDRYDRKRAMLAADGLSLAVQAALLAQVATDTLTMPVLYGLLVLLSVSVTLQRVAWQSAGPQLAPKHYLHHVGGVVQLGNAVAQLMVPLFSVALLSLIGITGILTANVVCYALAFAVTLLVRFPATMAWRRRETVNAEIRNGFRYLLRRRGLRAMAFTMFIVNFFLFTGFIMIPPLVLSVGELADTGRVALIAGIGAVCGGLTIALWGGPRNRRMFGMLSAAGVLGVFCAIAGLRPSLVLIAVGAFGMSLMMTISDGIWLTIIHSKVPQRYHARVISINRMLALSTQPVGLAVQAWLVGLVFEPLMRADGPLAGTVGRVIGVGEGRGIGLLYIVCGLAIATTITIALRHPALARFDEETPDAEADDLLGLEALRARQTPPAESRSMSAVGG
ncbi:amino acid adenylation domain-containing protein [Microbispora sp. RL4-1S]|uniref:Amino acid adenylation domain-containing protein n=1 Tax=Microbispora oryzae TaxID=2806554 RepID=A0A940WFH7_9ACTN|nr:non-ribosomal peptide synthetase/MFS transporter [Microbispora oryzae]MBP2703142.1 amino acid adenylation domain-containing protein [Microbispora oryzae]